MKYLLIALLLFLGCDDNPAAPQIEGCTNQSACNYDDTATIDNGTCTTNDECGVCGGDGSSCVELYFNVDIEDTGESTLFIFQNSITSLDAGDELGIFDSEGILDSDGNTGEILVGSGVWNGQQLEITAITAVDLSQFGGPILPGAVTGHPMSLRVWDSSENVVYDVTYDSSSGNGSFNGLFTVVSEIYLCEIPDGACDCDGNILDNCGVCDSISANDCVQDCLGTWGGSAVEDECGVCNGSGIPQGECDCDGTFPDCAGTCYGTLEYDACGVCNGDNSCVDCAGTPNGDAVVDECGVCDGDGSSCSGDGGIPTDWDTDNDGLFDNIHFYQNSGSITFRAFLDGVEVGSAGDALAAFVDGEQRGYVTPSEVPPPLGGGYAFLILIYSNEASGETITLKFYDEYTDTLYDVEETYDFVSNMVLGDVVTPEELTLSSPTAPENVYGCTDPNACNFNPDATIFDNSCTYSADGYDCQGDMIFCDPISCITGYLENCWCEDTIDLGEIVGNDSAFYTFDIEEVSGYNVDDYIITSVQNEYYEPQEYQAFNWTTNGDIVTIEIIGFLE